jgi:hypothetical protein
MDGTETGGADHQADGQIIHRADFGPLDHAPSLSQAPAAFVLHLL